eukprot:160700-Heterocapsa_arctica.AAC.1
MDVIRRHQYDDIRRSYKQNRAKVEGKFKMSFGLLKKYDDVSVQNDRHGGTGPQPVTPYAGNGLDDPKWENVVGVGATERQSCANT